MKAAVLSLKLALGAAIASSVLAPAAGPALAQSAGSLLLWPVSPVIEGDQPAAALWLENPGKAPITLQVRVYAWAQQNGENVYAAQNDILGTPPILTIAPGERQLVRLTRLVPPPSVPEKPYRVVVDQIPTSDAQTTPGAAVTFRMRYSLPLFSYARPEDARKKAPAPPPRLAWRPVSEAGGRFLEIRNSGGGHARLSGVAFSGNGKRSSLNEGLFGYVLPGATMRWPLPEGVDAAGDLEATLNGKAMARIERLPE
ncbi:fimbrial chaperone protein [Novosphingobium sp. PhB55]|uniref:fimbrial biogenesis chaperone n=1 Tax=Novosphingobium sp. PhB55 TaxID=2485106 RepID=UPI0010D317EF|nr:molecular chaperone [Novosphingobium sp. PhB55]TDW61818.1 fimbrial chaperone protein [Novosphingobium sp. PhB55]